MGCTKGRIFLKINFNNCSLTFKNQCFITLVALESKLSPMKCLESVQRHCRKLKLYCLLVCHMRKGHKVIGYEHTEYTNTEKSPQLATRAVTNSFATLIFAFIINYNHEIKMDILQAKQGKREALYILSFECIINLVFNLSNGVLE